MSTVVGSTMRLLAPPPKPGDRTNPFAHDGKERIPPNPAPKLEIITAAELVRRVREMPAPTFLVSPVWPSDAYGVLAAEWKAGKTWADLDLAVSVASGTPWLGHFPVERQGPVLLFLGEGGQRKMERRLQAICEAKGVDLGTLPLHLCFRTPHLKDGAQMDEIATYLLAVPAVLVIIDPLYLAARGASGSQLYEMGEALEGAQHVCQDAGAALLVVTHWNRNSTATGSARMTGAGPAEWGRVLINVSVRSKSTDPETKASNVILDLTAEGDELAETEVRMRRRVWADDPNDLASPLHYSIDILTDAKLVGGGEGYPPAVRKILGVLRGATGWATVTEIGDCLADGGSPLKKRTIQDALARLKADGLAESFGADGVAHSWRVAGASDEV